jgi:vitamin B12 transporter
MRWLVFATLTGRAWPAVSLAQEATTQDTTGSAGTTAGEASAPPEAEVQRLEPVVVTATMVPTPREQLGSAVTVITGEEITRYNYDRLEDTLRDVPGLQVQTSGSPGKATTLSIRGGGAQRSLVLIDGMRTSSPTLGATDIAEITIDAIDRIEIVRGPQSTLYGADAITGVVNIITKKGQGPPSARVWAEGGNYGTFRGQANVQGALEGFNWNVTGSQFNTAGNLPHDDSGQTAFSGRLGYDFPWRGELTLTGRYSNLDLELPIFSTAPTVLDPNATNHLETGLYKLAYTQQIAEWWAVTGSIGQWFNSSTFRDAPPPGTDITNSQINTSRVQGDVLSTFTIPRWNTLALGWEYRSESGTGTNQGTFPSAFSESLDTLAFFGQDELSIFDRVFLGGGLRWEDNNVYGRSLTGRASAALVVNETGSKLRFAWGQGFRAPTINDLFFPGFSNPDLRPERSVSWEVGADQRFWQGRIGVGATYFHQNFEELIQFVFDPTTFLFAPQNVGQARIQGVEAYASFDPVPWVGFYVNYTYLDAKDLDTGQTLARVPRNAVNTGVTVTPWTRLTLFMQANVVSSQLESEFAGTNPGHYRIDVGGTYLVLGQRGRLNRLELTARIQNLTNQKYDEVLGFPAPGISALVGLRAYVQ